jgi:hypothetical protein
MKLAAVLTLLVGSAAAFAPSSISKAGTSIKVCMLGQYLTLNHPLFVRRRKNMNGFICRHSFLAF